MHDIHFDDYIPKDDRTRCTIANLIDIYNMLPAENPACNYLMPALASLISRKIDESVRKAAKPSKNIKHQAKVKEFAREAQMKQNESELFDRDDLMKTLLIEHRHKMADDIIDYLLDTRAIEIAKHSDNKAERVYRFCSR